MGDSAVAAAAERLRPGPTATFGLVALVVLQALLAAVYVTSPAVTAISDPLAFGFVVVQPFVWIDVGLLAVVTTPVPSTTGRRRRVALVLAVAYFAVLAYFGGLFAPGVGTGAYGVNWRLPPGYSPRLFYDGAVVALTLEPYKLVGYAALAYLVFVTVVDAAGAALSGVVGVFSCISCTWPIVGTVAAGLFGGSSALAAAALNQAYLLSTLVFLSAVALLWWRPGFVSAPGPG